MKKKSREDLSSLVAKTIAKNTCSQHSKPITLVCLQNLKLGCQACGFPKSMNLEWAIKNPMEIAISYLNRDKNEAAKLLQNLKRKDQHNKVKIGFQALVQQISNRVNELCKVLLEEFNTRWDEAFGISDQKLEEIRKAEKHYKIVFEELLETGLREGIPTELQDLLNQFCSQCSEDPTDYTLTRIQSICSSYQQMPIINWRGLKQIYSTVTDPTIWSVSNLIKQPLKEHLSLNNKRFKGKTLQTYSNLILPEQISPLSNNKFAIKYETNQIELYENEEREYRELTKIKKGYDSLYQIDKSRLVGINYEGFAILSYGFGSLVVEQNFPIKACSNLLLFPQCFIAEAEGKIIRIWLPDKCKQVISLSGSHLTYGMDKYSFTFTNSKGEILTRSAYHGQL